MNKILNPSLLAADFTNLNQELNELKDNNINWLHIDILDGHFAPNISIGPDPVKQLRNKSDLFFDVHLMVTNPETFIPKFIDAGADSISFHVETDDDVSECLELIDKANIKKGLVISPDTPIEKLQPYLDNIDLITIMCVYPGFGGQKYIDNSTQRIKDIKKLIGHRDILISVDGGINSDTIEAANDAGADVFVAGTAVFNGDKAENIKQLSQVINKKS